MDEEILVVFRVLEEEKAEIRKNKNFEELTPDKKLAIELLDKIHGRIIKEMVLKI